VRDHPSLISDGHMPRHLTNLGND